MYINTAPVTETTEENFAPTVRSHFPYWALYVPNNTRPMELPLHTRQHKKSSSMNPVSMKKNPTVEMIIKSNELPRSSLGGFSSTGTMILLLPCCSSAPGKVLKVLVSFTLSEFEDWMIILWGGDTFGASTFSSTGLG